MDITLTLSPVEVDALQLAFDTQDLNAAIHQLVAPVVATTSEARLNRLADEYRELSPADQLEVVQVLADWKIRKAKPAGPVTPADPVVEIPRPRDGR
jgi:hypothetical protein